MTRNKAALSTQHLRNCQCFLKSVLLFLNQVRFMDHSNLIWWNWKIQWWIEKTSAPDSDHHIRFSIWIAFQLDVWWPPLRLLYGKYLTWLLCCWSCSSCCCVSYAGSLFMLYVWPVFVVLTERVISPLPQQQETIVEPSSSPFHSIRSPADSSILPMQFFFTFCLTLCYAQNQLKSNSNRAVIQLVNHPARKGLFLPFQTLRFHCPNIHL